MGVYYVLYSFSLLFMFRIVLYAIGDTYKDNVNKNAILFTYSYSLAKMALKRHNPNANELQFLKNIKEATILQKRDIKEMVFHAGKKYFTYENILGMCSICTFFWLSFFFVFLPNINAYGLFTWSLLQILNKIITKWI